MDARAAETAVAEEKRQSIAQEVQQTFRSLRHRNFRLYFFGQLVSLSGTWMQNLALSWLVYKLTNNAFMLGVVEFANLSPVLFLGLLGGWVADRLDRRKVLLTTQSLAMCQAAVLAILTLTGHIAVWQIIALAAINGCVFAFEIPSRQALLVNMVDRSDLVNAISLNSSLFNGTRVIGPAAAAIIVRFWGEGPCFAINAISYLAALAAIYMLTVPHDPHAARHDKRTIGEGLRYAFKTPSVRGILRLTAMLSLFGAQFSLLMPVVAKEILHHDIEGFGALKSGAAVGSLIAALALANRGSGPMLTRGVGYASLAFGMTLVVFALSHNFFVSVCLVLVLGFCMTFQLSGSHSLLQLNVADEMRGRLMSVWTMMIMGLSPVGSLLIGWCATHFGAAPTLAVAAAIAIVSALVYLLRRG